MILLVARGGRGTFFFLAAAVADDSVTMLGTCVRSDVVSISLGVLRKNGLEEDDSGWAGESGTVRTSGCVCAGSAAQRCNRCLAVNDGIT